MKSELSGKKVAYIHYQRYVRDGSHVHTSNFIREFSEIALKKDIQFIVKAPEPDFGVPGLKENKVSALKSWLARFYLSDIKNILVQIKRCFEEIRFLKEQRVDIVLTRYMGNTVSIVWACRLLKIPVAIEINGPDEEVRETHFYRVPLIAKIFNSDHLVSSCDGVFSVSQLLADRYLKAVNGKIPVYSIPNGVNVEQFKAVDSEHLLKNKLALNIAADELVIGFVGSFAPWHRVDMLIRSFSQLIAKGYKARLLLVGEIRLDTKENILTAVDKDIEPLIIFSGFVSKENVSSYVGAMDIAVLPNSEDYCSPLKLFEYMAMSRAVVSVDTPSVREIIRDEQEGLLFERGDEVKLTSHLEALLKDGERRELLGHLARKRMEESFTWTHNAQKVEQLLEEVYQRNAKPQN